MKKEYIGDGVYVELNCGQLVLTTENGIRTTNTIYLEPEVWSALTSYVTRLVEDAKANLAVERDRVLGRAP